MWHMTCDASHMTHCWRFRLSQNVRYLALTAWVLWCFKDWEKKDHSLNSWMNLWGTKVLVKQLGPQNNQGKWFDRKAGFTEWFSVCTLPPDQEETPAWQRPSGPGKERDSCSCLGMVLTGTGSGACWAETVHRGSREIFLVLFGNG